MALQNLSEHEASILMSCVRVASQSDLFPDWEFDTLFGLTRSEVALVAA